MKLVSTTLALGVSLAAAADPECSAQCGSEIGFVSSQGPELLIKYDGKQLHVPQHCRSEVCSELASDSASLEADVLRVKDDVGEMAAIEAGLVAGEATLFQNQAALQAFAASQAAENGALRKLIASLTARLGAVESTHAADHRALDGELGDLEVAYQAADDALQASVDAVAKMPGAPGAKGAKGDKGDQGDKGDPGLAATPAPTPVVARTRTTVGEAFLAADCDEITVEGAGYGDTNGVYAFRTGDRYDGGIAGSRYWCKGSNCEAGQFNLYNSWGWGIQNHWHHRYQNREFGPTINPFTEVREPGHYYSGRYPIPTFHCSKWRGGSNAPPAAKRSLAVGEAFLAAKCHEITVTGAGYGDTNGVYAHMTGERYDGGIAGSRYWCKGFNCEAGQFNLYNSWGWGIQNHWHHRYQNREFGTTINPFTEVREPNGPINHCGRYPIPTFHCSDFRE